MNDTLALVADAITLRTIHSRFNEELAGSNKSELDSLEFLFRSFEGLAGYGVHGDFSWEKAKESFVENFSRLVLRSQMQVGQSTGKTYANIQDFIQQ